MCFFHFSNPRHSHPTVVINILFSIFVIVTFSSAILTLQLIQLLLLLLLYSDFQRVSMQQEASISFILPARVMTFERRARGASTPSNRPPSSAPGLPQPASSSCRRAVERYCHSFVGRCYGVLAFKFLGGGGRLQPPFQRQFARNAVDAGRIDSGTGRCLCAADTRPPRRRSELNDGRSDDQRRNEIRMRRLPFQSRASYYGSFVVEHTHTHTFRQKTNLSFGSQLVDDVQASITTPRAFTLYTYLTTKREKKLLIVFLFLWPEKCLQ